MAWTVNASDLASMGARYQRAASVLPSRIQEQLRTLAPQVEAIGVSEIRAVTPVGLGDPETGRQAGQLRDKTVAATTFTNSGFVTAVDQPALSGANLDGSGGNFPYVIAVIQGRAGFTAPSSGQWSTGKLGLRTPWGVRRWVGPAEGHDYPVEAVRPIADALSLLTRKWGRALIASVMR